MINQSRPVARPRADSTVSRASRRGSRDTGFPDFFDQTSTTLPHPDADTSPNACLSHDESVGDLALKRRRHTLLRNRHKRNLSHGFITAEESQTASQVVTSSPLASSSSTTVLVSEEPSKMAVSRTSTASLGLSKDGSESIQSKKDDETPPASPNTINSQTQRSRLFGRWLRA